MVNSNHGSVRREIDRLYILGDKKMREAYKLFDNANKLFDSANTLSSSLVLGRKPSLNLDDAVKRAKMRAAKRKQFSALSVAERRKLWRVSKAASRSRSSKI